MPSTELSTEAYRVLRACSLNLFDGLDFVRCGRNLTLVRAAELAEEIRNFTGDSFEQVCNSQNKELGLNDYVRVSRNSKAYRLICHMKS